MGPIDINIISGYVEDLRDLLNEATITCFLDKLRLLKAQSAGRDRNKADTGQVWHV